MFKEKIIIEMKEVFKEIPFGIEHTLKVLKNAEDIMNGENIGEEFIARKKDNTIKIGEFGEVGFAKS